MPKTSKGSGVSAHEAKLISKIHLSKTICCTGCGESKSHVGFSSHKLFILKKQIHAGTAFKDRDIRCKTCTPRQSQVLMCSFCDEHKSFGKFSRMQRSYGDRARCKRCVELHQGPPPGWEKDYPYSGDEYDVEDEYDEDEYEYEYAVRQLIRPEDDGCHLPGPPAPEAGEGELSSAFQNLTTESHQGGLGEQAEQGSSRATSSSRAQHGSSCSDSEPSGQQGHSWSGSENPATPAPPGYHWNGPEYPDPFGRQVSRSQQGPSLSGSGYPTASPQQGPSRRGSGNPSSSGQQGPSRSGFGSPGSRGQQGPPRSGSGFPSSRPQEGPSWSSSGLLSSFPQQGSSRSGSGFSSSRPQQGPSRGDSGFQSVNPPQGSSRSGSEFPNPRPQRGHSQSSSGFPSLSPNQRPSNRGSRHPSSRVQQGPSGSGSGQPSSSKAEGKMVAPIGEETKGGWELVEKTGFSRHRPHKRSTPAKQQKKGLNSLSPPPTTKPNEKHPL